jgi:hypothetical protein
MSPDKKGKRHQRRREGRSGVTDASGRQARLRPEYALLYPGLEPGFSVNANDLAERMVTQHLLRPSPGFMLSSRMLPGEHFDFRGGEPAGRPRIARTRRSDPAT